MMASYRYTTRGLSILTDTEQSNIKCAGCYTPIPKGLPYVVTTTGVDKHTVHPSGTTMIIKAKNTSPSFKYCILCLETLLLENNKIRNVSEEDLEKFKNDRVVNNL